MIGLVLVAHGGLATEFIGALEHIVGKQEQITAIPIAPEDDMETRRHDILEAVDNNDSGDGVIVLTDMFGGTPSNLAISIMEQSNIEVIAGMNLPMLIELASKRKEFPLDELVIKAQEAGKKYINVASGLLGRKKEAKDK